MTDLKYFFAFMAVAAVATAAISIWGKGDSADPLATPMPQEYGQTSVEDVRTKLFYVKDDYGNCFAVMAAARPFSGMAAIPCENMPEDVKASHP